YKIPPLGDPDASPTKSVFYVHDDSARLQDRAERLLKKEAHVEYPHSTTTRNYHNILVNNLESDVISVECNFTTHRTKREVVDTFIMKAMYELVHENSELAIRSKTVMLKVESFSAHEKVILVL